MNARRLLQIALGTSAGLLVALLLVRPAARPADPAAPGGPLLAEPLPAPPLALTSHRGEPVRIEDFRGRPVAVFFGYTYCPDLCPVTLAHLSRALREEEGAAERLQVLFVTVDPQRDTPEVLARYLEGFHPSILGLTGPTGDVDAQARGFGVAIRRGEGPGYLVDHGARTYLLDGDGRIAGTVPTGASYADVRDGVRAILERVR
jgi:protein SCO1/2